MSDSSYFSLAVERKHLSGRKCFVCVSLWCLMIILQQSAPMPFVSYFLQFPTLALDFGRPEPDAPMSANDENRNKHLTADCLPAPESTRPAAHCPVLYTQWAKLPTAVYPSSPSGSITHPGCYCRPVLLYISVHVGVESELLAVKSVLNYARWYFTAWNYLHYNRPVPTCTMPAGILQILQ